PFNDRTHPDHAKAIDQYLALNQRALAPASARPPALSLDHFHSAPSGSGATPTTPDAIEAQIVSLERDHAELEQRLDALRHPKTRWPVDAELQASRILALTRQQLAVEEKLKTAMSEADRARAAAAAPPPREIPWRVPGRGPEPEA